jgi:hypothetical protein
MPFELRPYPTPTLRPEGAYLQNAWRQSIYPIARRMGVDIKLPQVSPQPYTRLAFEGLEFAKDRDKGDEYNDRVMRAFFQESRNIGDARCSWNWRPRLACQRMSSGKLLIRTSTQVVWRSCCGMRGMRWASRAFPCS